MSLFSIFEIAGSALNAQSVRLNATASNMANANSSSSSIDSIYRARHPVFSPLFANELSFNEPRIAGVRVDGIIESQAPFRREYQPNHPHADEKGPCSCPTSTLSRKWPT